MTKDEAIGTLETLKKVIEKFDELIDYVETTLSMVEEAQRNQMLIEAERDELIFLIEELGFDEPLSLADVNALETFWEEYKRIS